MKFSPDSKFYQFCVRLVELVGLNLLWLLCSIPVVTAGAAATALYTCLYQRRRGEDWSFFRAFRSRFWVSTGLWLGMVFLGAMLALDYYLAASLQFPGYMAAIGLICFAGLSLMLVGSLVFPLVSQFPGGVKDTLVNAVLLSVANLPKVLLITAAHLLPLALLILLPQVMVLTGFAWLLVGAPVLALYDIRVLERVFAPYGEE